jgi:hypothetical protein
MHARQSPTIFRLQAIHTMTCGIERRLAVGPLQPATRPRSGARESCDQAERQDLSRPSQLTDLGRSREAGGTELRFSASIRFRDGLRGKSAAGSTYSFCEHPSSKGEEPEEKQRLTAVIVSVRTCTTTCFSRRRVR